MRNQHTKRTTLICTVYSDAGFVCGVILRGFHHSSLRWMGEAFLLSAQLTDAYTGADFTLQFTSVFHIVEEALEIKQFY